MMLYMRAICTIRMYLKASSFAYAGTRRMHRTHTHTYARHIHIYIRAHTEPSALPHSANVALHMQHESRRRVISAYVTFVCAMRACVRACARFIVLCISSRERVRYLAIRGVRKTFQSIISRSEVDFFV